VTLNPSSFRVLALSWTQCTLELDDPKVDEQGPSTGVPNIAVRSALVCVPNSEYPARPLLFIPNPLSQLSPAVVNPQATYHFIVVVGFGCNPPASNQTKAMI